jgi:hypothetical protein
MCMGPRNPLLFVLHSVPRESIRSIVPFCYPVSMPSSSSQPFCQMLTLSLCFSARHVFPVLQQKRQIHRHLSLDSRLLCVIVSSYVSYPSIFTIRILPFCSFFSFLPLWTHPLMISCPINHSPYAPTILFFYLKIIYQFHLFFPCLVLRCLTSAIPCILLFISAMCSSGIHTRQNTYIYAQHFISVCPLVYLGDLRGLG